MDTQTETTTQPEPKREVYECPKCRSRAYGPGWCYCRTPAVQMRKAKN